MYSVMCKFARNEVIWKALKIIKTRFHVPIKSVLKFKAMSNRTEFKWTRNNFKKHWKIFNLFSLLETIPIWYDMD